MNRKITQTDINKLIVHLETFNETTQEDEIQELTDIVTFIMDLGAGWTPKLKAFFEDDRPTDYILLNSFIDAIDITKMKPIYSSGILRYTYSHKEKIKNWDDLYNRLYQQCLEKNMDTEDVFFGLKEQND